MLQDDVLREARRQIDRFRIAALEDAESRREEEIVEGAAANRGQEIRHAAIIARLISCTPLRTRRLTHTALSLLLALVFGPSQSGHDAVLAQGGPITVLAREGRRTLPTIELQGRQMVGLDDLAGLFQLQVREDAAARAITATYKGQTIVMTPDQSLVSSSGRLVSLPAPLTRRNNRWLVPVEFISRALAPIYDVRLDLRPASRLLVLGDLRVPRVTAQYDDGPSLLRVTLETTPRATARRVSASRS